MKTRKQIARQLYWSIIITLKFNGVITPIKSQVLDSLQKTNQELTTCCLQERHFKNKYTKMLNVQGWKKVYHASLIIRMIGKVDYRTRNTS